MPAEPAHGRPESNRAHPRREAPEAAPEAAPDRIDERLDEHVVRSRLPAGPLVLSERVDSVRSVAVGVWIRHGAACDSPEHAGVSHFLEHAVFKGTSRRSAFDLAAEIERLGGSLDAYTTHEFTAFLTRVPDLHLEPALDVLVDLVFHPTLREQDVALERNVILDEIAGVEDAPEQLVFDLHAPFLYGGHPYGAPILGTRDTVSALGADELRRLHAASYRPQNCVVAACGRLDQLELADRLAEILPRAEPAAPSTVESTPATEIGHRVVKRSGGRQTHIVAGCLTVPYAHPLRYAIILAETALGAGMSSRLFQKVREELGLAYSVYSFTGFHHYAGHAGAYLGTLPDTSEEALDVLLGELRRFAEQGLSTDEIEDAKQQLKGQLMVSLEAPTARMQRLAALGLYGRPYRTLDQLSKRIDRVTAGDVMAACQLFHPDRLAVLELSPA